MIDKFPCTSCGLCCQRIYNLKEFSEALSIQKSMPDLIFPYSNESGICEKYIDNKCSVYEDRPIICNISKMQEILEIEAKEFYKMNASICNLFIREEGLDESFIINL
jgi:Fe-S-cluster containining protein